MMMLTEIENVFDDAFTEITVDEKARVLRNVALVGTVSRNGRRYPVETLRAAVGKYEGVKVYVDHPDDRDEKRGWRSTRDLAGRIENARFDGSKIRGDLRLLGTEGGKLVYEIATTIPSAAGMSHNAAGRTKRENGEEVVESIERVISVDVVTEPATNDGFYEQKNQSVGDSKMDVDYSKVTLYGLKETRRDLVEDLVLEGKKSRDQEVQELIDEVEKLKTENTDLKKKLDEAKVREALREKEALVDKLLDESELPDEAKTDVFREMLLSVPVKEGEKFEEKAKELIEDRKTAIGAKGVTNYTEKKGGPGGSSKTKEPKTLSEAEKLAIAKRLKSA